MCRIPRRASIQALPWQKSSILHFKRKMILERDANIQWVPTATRGNFSKLKTLLCHRLETYNSSPTSNERACRTLKDILRNSNRKSWMQFELGALHKWFRTLGSFYIRKKKKSYTPVISIQVHSLYSGMKIYRTLEHALSVIIIYRVALYSRRPIVTAVYILAYIRSTEREGIWTPISFYTLATHREHPGQLKRRWAL